ncbi:MAG: M28 family peptidase [Armatimonadota bacterium]
METHRFSPRLLCRSGILALLLVAPLSVGSGCQNGATASNIDGAPPASLAPAGPAFDSKRAFGDLQKQVAFGPRVSQTKGHEDALNWLLAELKKSAGDQGVRRQDFTAPLGGKRLPMTNVIAQFNPTAKKQVLLCAHWDTRPTADMEIDAAKKKQPIPGANDGASGVAVLLELARQFAAKPPPVGVQIVFFDGEDYGPGNEQMYLGARYYARRPARPLPAYAILIDMIGDKDLQIWREQYSETNAREINDKVWKAAEALGAKAFQPGVKFTITDDHLPLQESGIKAIDLIDFDYGPWHTLDDTPAQCSPASLKTIGDVLAKVIYDEKP